MVTAPAGLNMHTDTNSAAPVLGTFPYGTWVHICEVLGQNIEGNSIWDFVGGGGYVSDYWMSTPTFGTTMYYGGVDYRCGNP
jgi:hypothetical protein